MNAEQSHKLAAAIEHLSANFLRIKTISSSAEIDRLCIDGRSKLVALRQELGIEKAVKAIQARRIDSMM